jgi:Ca2+:H+ antiporter
VLVFLSYFIGPEPMDLVFSPLEVLAVVLSAVLVNFVALDGKSHWMEGVQLLAVYCVFGIAFYFLPPWGEEKREVAKTELSVPLTGEAQAE